MSAGPGAYLEPEAAAAQIAAGRQGRGFDSDDEQGDVLGDAIAVPSPARPKDPDAAKEGSAATTPAAAAAANGGAGAPGAAAPMDVEPPLNVTGDPNDPEYQMRVRQQLEQAAREQEMRRLASLGGVPYDGVAGVAGVAAAAEYGPEYAAAAAAAAAAGGVYMGPDGSAAAAAAGGGYGRRDSFEASDREPSEAADSDKDSDEDEEEVDWEDSADEDVDAATAEAMEQARIGMARAAARELRESRATR